MGVSALSGLQERANSTNRDASVGLISVAHQAINPTFSMWRGGIGLLTTCQQFQHFIHAGGCARRSMTDSSSSALVRLVITECARCYGLQYQSPDGQCHLLFTEAHAFRVLAEHHARFQYRSFASTVPCGTAIDSPR